jgi:protein-arginine kinase activator protein McsA
VCMECAPAFEKLAHGGPGLLGEFVMSASAERARAAGIDPSAGCPGCGTTLVTIVTEAQVGCEMCYERFRADIAPTIDLIQGWGSHVGKSPSG